jgi:hypothetical protein
VTNPVRLPQLIPFVYSKKLNPYSFQVTENPSKIYLSANSFVLVKPPFLLFNTFSDRSESRVNVMVSEHKADASSVNAALLSIFSLTPVTLP